MLDLSLKRHRKACSRNVQEHLVDNNASASSLYAVMLCHEHFLEIVAAEMANQLSSSGTVMSTTLTRSQNPWDFPNGIVALKRLLWIESKPAKKKQTIMANLKAEQQRLLAASSSKEKALQSGK